MKKETVNKNVSRQSKWHRSWYVIFMLLFVMVQIHCRSVTGLNQKIDLVKQIPQIEGSWLWRHTVVGGFVGIVSPRHEDSLILTFEPENKLSVECNGKMIVTKETFEVTVPKDSTRGKYIIALPEPVKNRLEAGLTAAHMQVVTSGYIDFARLFKNDETDHLVISKTTGVNVGYEGGPNFHHTSSFIPINAKNK